MWIICNNGDLINANNSDIIYSDTDGTWIDFSEERYQVSDYDVLKTIQNAITANKNYVVVK